MEITANNQILVLTAKASVTETSISLIRRYGPPPNVAFSKWPLSSINCPPYPCYRLHYLLWRVSVRVNRFNATFLHTVFEALWKNVYLFLERCKKSKYGCVLLDADRLFIFLFILILRTWVYFFSHFLVI